MTSLRLRISWVLGAFALGAAALPLCAPATAGAQAPQGTVDLIVRRDAGLDAAARAELRDDAGVRFERRLRLADTEVVTVPADRAADAMAALQADPEVRWAQRDGLARAQAVTTDPWFAELWGLRNTGQLVDGVVAGTADADMDVPEAWAESTGAGVTVAVVDTGVDAAHPDLQGQLAVNAGEMGSGRAANGVDDDHDGLVDDWRGYDFEYDDNNPSDVEGHGSHVAGTIAARNGNGVGITGLAPDARILPLKALGDDGYGSWSAIADAFDFAGDMGIRVVNASLGGQGELPVLSDVIAQHPNTLYVVSAGNDNADMDVTSYTPCEVPQPNVLCVGASDSSDLKASFSNYSPTSVDVFAPGVRVLSTSLGEYWYMGGTSMASPHVAGEAALLVARYPGLSALAIKDAIIQSAEPKAALAPYGHDGRRANAQAALARVAAADHDADGVANAVDNCLVVANPGQADADHDGAGDLCDATVRGPDTDLDGLVDMDDACPVVPGVAASGGCPPPAPPAPAPVAVVPVVPSTPVAATPPVAALPSVVRTAIGTVRTVPAGRPACRAGRCTRTVTVGAKLSAGAKVATVTAQAKVCARGRCTWRTVARSTSARIKLVAGRYRLTVVATGPGGRATKVVTVAVPKR